MTTAAIRERLHDYIREAEDKKVEAIYTLLEDELAPYEWSEDKEFVAELNDRMNRYEAGIDKGVTWEQLETSIENLREKRLKSE